MRWPVPRSRSIASINPAACWENSSNSSPRTTRRPIPAPCSPFPSSRRSQTLSPSSAQSVRRKIMRLPTISSRPRKPFCFGGTDPALTKMGNPWMIRFRPNDTYSGRVIASYGVETLGKKNWALVHSTDAFGTSGNKLLAAALDKLGAKVAIDQGYPNQSQDFTPVVLAIKSSRRRRHRLLFHLRKRSGDFRSAVATTGRHNPLGRIADDGRRRHAEAGWPGALGHLRRRRLRDRLVSGGEGVRQALQRCLDRPARPSERLAL